jgi:hypothetical protein
MNAKSAIKDRTTKKSAKKEHPVIVPKPKGNSLSKPLFSKIATDINTRMGEPVYHSEEYYQNHDSGTGYVPIFAQMPDTLNGLMIDAMVSDISILQERPNTNWNTKD